MKNSSNKFYKLYENKRFRVNRYCSCLMHCIHNQDGILEFLFKNTYLWKIIQIYTKLSLCLKCESVIHVWIMIITWFLYCWWLPPTSNPHLPCCFFTPGGYFTIFGSVQEINMKKVIQMWIWDHTREYTTAQLHVPFIYQYFLWAMGSDSWAMAHFPRNTGRRMN